MRRGRHVKKHREVPVLEESAVVDAHATFEYTMPTEVVLDHGGCRGCSKADNGAGEEETGATSRRGGTGDRGGGPGGPGVQHLGWPGSTFGTLVLEGRWKQMGR